MTVEKTEDSRQLAAPPIAGRARQFNRLIYLWREVVRTNQLRTVVLEGPTGAGKSNLLEALTREIRPEGGRLEACHGPSPDPGQGLAHLVGSAFGAHEEADELDADRLAQRGYDESLRAGLCEILRPLYPVSCPDSGGVFSNPSERFSAVTRWLSHEARRGPRLVVLRDVQWGRATLDWLQSLMNSEAADEMPVLVVVTALEEELAGRPVESVQWESLLDDERAESIGVQLLSDRAIREVVRQTAPLEEGLVERIVDRSQGSPTFAREVILDWQERGVLERRGGVLHLDDTEDVTVPDSVYEVWRRSLERHIEGFDSRRSEARVSLEIAAIFGGPVRHGEWREACRRRGVEMPDLLPRTVVKTGLFEEIEGGEAVCVSHPLVRETLVRQAREAGRYRAHHRVCADVALDSETLDDGEAATRAAHHRLEAGESEAALDPLLEGIRAAAISGELTRAEWLFERYEGAMAELELPDGDGRRIRGKIYRGWLAYARGEHREAGQVAIELLDRVDSNREPGSMARAFRLLSAASLELGETTTSMDAAERGLEMARVAGERSMVARLYDRRGRVRRFIGNLEGARADFDEALARFLETDRVDWIGGAHLTIATVERRRERYREARRHLEEARKLYEDAGYRQQIASCYNFEGEIARQRERWGEAIQSYVRAIRTNIACGSNVSIIHRLNLGYALIGASEFTAAIRHLRRVRGRAEDDGLVRWGLHAELGLLACAAGLQNWGWARELLGRVAAGVGRTGVQSFDFGMLFEQAGGLAERCGRSELAEVCWEMAENQWKALGRTDRLTDVQRRLDGLYPDKTPPRQGGRSAV